MPQETQILIVGAGPTGLVMAGELARRGIRCRIVDIARAPTDLSKAVGIQARTLEAFQNMGLAEQFTAIGNPIHAANIYDNAVRIAHVPFDGLDSPFPYLLVLAQSETERILLSHLKRLGVPVERGVKMTGFTQDETSVQGTLQHEDGHMEEVRADWLVGCDGAHSTVRHGLNLPFAGQDYSEGFLLADVRVDWSLPEDEVFILFRDGWLLGVFPFGKGRCRLVGSMPTEDAPLDRQPTLPECQALMDSHSPVPAKLSDPHWTAYYRIHRRIVSKLRQGRAFLVGDAAHIHSPAGAQGMNTGIQDAFNLAWKLALVVQGGSPESLLDSYEAERLPVEQGVLEATDLMLKVGTVHQPAARAVRDALAAALTRLAPIQNAIVRRISEVAVAYHDSPIVAENAHSVHFHAGPDPGDRAPDAPVSQPPSAAQSTLYELLRTESHTLLLLSGPTPTPDVFQELTALAKQVEARYDSRITTRLITTRLVVASTTPPPASLTDGVWLLDPEQVLHHRYGSVSPCVFLIRPDGYIGFRGQPAAYEPLYGYLEEIFVG